ncbi:hypothetical protein [Streptomyces sp. S1]|uniref:hypothetical protein n=1 Tax=Streptomyces sp. S1 TaxID=718288 RepID=UPI003D738964
MTTVPAPTATPPAALDTDITHIVCCDDDTALCGLDVSGFRWHQGGEDCVVCLDLRGPCGPNCPFEEESSE